MEAHAPQSFDFDAAWRAVEPDDLLTLIYTSGTTGPPKGVQLDAREPAWPASTGSTRSSSSRTRAGSISWLPMAHIAERACSHYLPMFVGFSTTCCPDPRQVVAYLPEVRPTWFFAVPRIWEKLKAAIEAGIEAEQDAAKKQATQWALDVGLRKVARRGRRRRVREGRRARALQDPRAAGAGPGRVGERGRGAHAAGGDRVLPRPRHPAGGALGHVRDQRLRRLQPAGADQDRHRGAARARAPRSSWPRTARC